MATLAGFRKRIKLTIDHTKIGEDLTTFPLTVHLNSAQGEEVFAELGSDANKFKIAFTTFNGSTQLYAEIEQFSYTNKKACYHISRSGYVIKSASDEVIYMYYDSTAADNTTYIGIGGSAAGEAVWDANFKMVQHFNTNPGAGDNIDSTSNDADGVPQGSMTIADLIDGLGNANAHDLDGTDDYYTRGTAGMLHGLTNMTIEAVVNCRSASGNHFIWSEAKFDGEILFLRIEDGKVSFYLNDGSWHGAVSAGTIGTTNKEYVAGSLHSTNGMTTFIAGAVDGTDASTASSTGAITRADICYGQNSANFSNMIIGELRLSSVCRSAHWIKATNHSLKDTLLIYGNEEILGSALFFSFNF